MDDAMDPDLARFIREELGDTGAPLQWETHGPVWVWRGAGAGGALTKTTWYFVTIGGDVGAAIRATMQGRRRGFGSVRVFATIGGTRWQTALFPHRESGGYMLPLKAMVRKREALEAGKEARVSIELE